MTDIIIKAAAQAVYECFGEGFRIYLEAVEQGLKEPCFFITLDSASSKVFLGKRYLNENLLLIKFYPEKGKHEREQCESAAEKLCQCLEWVKEDDCLLHGTKIHYDIVRESGGEVLNLWVNYNMFVYKEEHPEPMREMRRRISARQREEIEG